MFPVELTADVRSLIKNLLNMEMDKRPTAEEVRIYIKMYKNLNLFIYMYICKYTSLMYNYRQRR